MRFKFLIIPSVLFFQLADAQNDPSPLVTSQATITGPVSTTTSSPNTPPVTSDSPASTTSTLTRIIDYKSVYEAATVEEEVKMAAERFSLNPDQQEMWNVAATERRRAEKIANDKLASKSVDYQKEPVYRGLKSAHTTFFETIIGHLSPSQKSAIENDRLIIQERQMRMASIPPPAPAPTVTAAPVDSAAIKEPEKPAKSGKKSKKKKKPVSQ